MFVGRNPVPCSTLSMCARVTASMNAFTSMAYAIPHVLSVIVRPHALAPSHTIPFTTAGATAGNVDRNEENAFTSEKYPSSMMYHVFW
jgi:hypothetical protein